MLLPLFRYVLHTKLLFFQKLTPYPHIFFHLKSFLLKGPLTVKVRKKIINKFNWWSCSKNQPNTKLNQILREKRHKNWKQECKQKHSLLFNFCNIFDLLTSRTQKIACDLLFLTLVFTYFPIMNNSGKFKEILSTSFYCIIPP